MSLRIAKQASIGFEWMVTREGGFWTKWKTCLFRHLPTVFFFSLSLFGSLSGLVKIFLEFTELCDFCGLRRKGLCSLERINVHDLGVDPARAHLCL